MPVIRYDIKDIGTFTDESCQCGRGLSLMKSIEGRESDIITTPLGILSLSISSVLFGNIPGIDQFQVIQEKIDHLTIKIVTNTYSPKRI